MSSEPPSLPPRISPPSAYDATQLAELAKAPHRPDGEPLNAFATLAHRPELMRRVNALGGYFARSSKLPVRTREIAILRVAGTLDCAYGFITTGRWRSRRDSPRPRCVRPPTQRATTRGRRPTARSWS